MIYKNVFVTLMVIALTMFLSGCDLPDTTFLDTTLPEEITGNLEIVLDPASGTGDVSYHIEIDLESVEMGSIEELYWQISSTKEYDEDKWIEADTCWFLCDYVIDIENVDDGEYYVIFKVVTSKLTEYIVSNETYLVMQDEYSISFNSNQGTSVDPLSQEYGSVVVEPNTPLKEGFEFEDWYIDSSLTTPYVFSTMPFENITLYAKWIELTIYTITIDANGGEVDSTSLNVNEADHLMELPIPTYSGYEFFEWRVDGEAITLPIAIFDDITVVASYRQLEPREVLFDYYKEHYPQENIIDHSDEDYLEILTVDPRFEVEYTLSGKYYHFYYNESKDDVIFMITVDLVNSTIRCDANDGEYYERDFLYTYYDGNISMRDYEIIEGYFEDVSSLVGGSTLQQELNYIYGYGLELSDFNPNWDTLDALPETSYETHILDTIEQVTINVYSVELSALGDEYYLYYEITNNSDEDITFMWFKTEYVLITGVIGEDYYFWTGELEKNTTIYITKVVDKSSLPEWYGNTLNYILDVAIE